jgi:hypothetical protein
MLQLILKPSSQKGEEIKNRPGRSIFYSIFSFLKVDKNQPPLAGKKEIIEKAV